MPEQKCEQGKLTRLQVDQLASTGDFTGDEIKRYVASDKFRRLGRRAGATDERVHARQQLGKCERFRQIVITSALKPAHAIVNRALGAEEEDGRQPPRQPKTSNETG